MQKGISMEAKKKLKTVAQVTAESKPKLSQSELRANRRKGEIDLSDVLIPDDNTRVDAETAIRCIAYLMEYAVDCGNRPLNGRIVVGLSEALRFCAAEVNKLYDRDEVQYEIQDSGGDIHNSPAMQAIYGNKE